MKKGLEVREVLVTLWVFLGLNYILCDLISNMDAGTLQGLLVGDIGGVKMTQGMLLFAGISLEIPFLMVVLTKILNWKIIRILNLFVPVLMIVYQVGSFAFGTETTMHYLFFSIIEIGANIVIFVLALLNREVKDHGLYPNPSVLD